MASSHCWKISIKRFVIFLVLSLCNPLRILFFSHSSTASKRSLFSSCWQSQWSFSQQTINNQWCLHRMGGKRRFQRLFPITKKVYWPRGQHTMDCTFSDDNTAKYFRHVTVCRPVTWQYYNHTIIKTDIVIHHRNVLVYIQLHNQATHI